MIDFLRNLYRFPKLLIRNWELLWSFVFRELKAKYEGSMLGMLWPVLQPVALFAIYYFIFAKLLKLPVSIDLMPWGEAVPGQASVFQPVAVRAPAKGTARALGHRQWGKSAI